MSIIICVYIYAYICVNMIQFVVLCMNVYAFVYVHIHICGTYAVCEVFVCVYMYVFVHICIWSIHMYVMYVHV